MEKKYPFMLAIDIILKIVWYLQWLFILVLITLSIIILIDPAWINIEKISGFHVDYSRIFLGDINLNDGANHIAYISNGHGRLHISNYKQNFIYLRIFSALLDTLIYIYIIFLLRKIFSSIKTGVFFNKCNGEYIKKIAYAVLILSILPELISYIVVSHIAKTIEINNVILNANLDFDFRSLFLGLLIFVMAKVFIRGAEIKEENELTI